MNGIYAHTRGAVNNMLVKDRKPKMLSVSKLGESENENC